MAQANMAVQVIVILILAVAFFLQLRRRYIWHGNVLLVSVMAVTLMLVMHMAPTYIYVALEVVKQPNLIAALALAHGLIGVATLAPGIWLVGEWAYAKSSDITFCSSKRRMMRAIIACWIIAFVSALIYYPLHLFFG